MTDFTAMTNAEWQEWYIAQLKDIVQVGVDIICEETKNIECPLVSTHERVKTIRSHIGDLANDYCAGQRCGTVSGQPGDIADFCTRVFGVMNTLHVRDVCFVKYI
jgi:hypothetical protein